MTLRVVGAGLGRTGTHSLKLALERLLGAPCYHMLEVFEHLEHVPVWHAAVRGEPVDWEALFTGYVAAVDWPAGAFWRELSATYPDALVLLSVRSDAAAWWHSVEETIFQAAVRRPPEDSGMVEWYEMVQDMLRLRFTENWQDPEEAKAAYERHNETVRASVPAARLLEWRPADGWEPICERLGVPVPDEPFPHVNTTAEFRAMAGLDAPPPA
jgi:hypothetical protein